MSVRANLTRRKPSRIVMVWRTRQNEVEAEMEALYERDGGSGKMDNQTKLKYWTTAASNVYKHLGDQEKVEVSLAIERAVLEGNPPEIQEKRAIKHGSAKVRQWAAERWKDMGMLTVTFYAYKKQGRVAIGL